jgi:hypothetical protein
MARSFPSIEYHCRQAPEGEVAGRQIEERRRIRNEKAGHPGELGAEECQIKGHKPAYRS